MAGLRQEVGATYREAARFYGRHPVALVVPGLVIFVLTGLPAAALEEVHAANLVEALAVGVAQFIGFVTSYLFYGYCEELAEQARRGPVSVRAGLAATIGVLPALIIASVVSTAGIAIGFALLILPGLYLLVRWALVTAVVTVERVGPVRAMRRSNMLSRGRVPYLLLTAVAVVLAEQLLSGLADVLAEHVDGHHLVLRAVEDVIVDVIIGPFAGLMLVGAYARVTAA
jgi:uncharacterized membrane protein